MVYANDQWVQLPVRSLYDSQMMLSAINAAKGEYERGLLDMKDFNKEYGDFLSPILKDMDWYALNVTGKVKNAIDTMYANGIDLRSPEARAKLGLIINSVNPGDVAKLRQSAAAANEYIKNRGALDAAGKYDPDQEAFLLNGNDFSNWDTLGGNGIWNRTSPMQARSLKELTQDWFDKRTPYELTAEQAKRELGASYDPRKKYTGWLDEDLLSTAAQRIPGFVGSPYGQYFRERARQLLKSYGYNDPTDEQVDAMLQRNIANANREYLVKPVGDMKEWLGLLNLNLERQKLAETRRANRQKENSNNPYVLGFTDRVRYGVNVSSQEKAGYSKLYSDLRSGLGKDGAKKQLIAEGNKNPTEAQIKARMKQNALILRDNKDVYAMNYATYTTTPDGTDLLTARALAAGLTPEQVYESGLTNIKGRLVTFTPTGSLDLTTRRHMAYAGQRLTSGSASERLYKYLTGHGIKGIIADEDVSTSYKLFAPGHRIYDVNFKAEIKKSDLAELLRERYANDDAKMLKSLANAGCILKTKTGKEVDPEDSHKLVWSNIDKIVIPVSRTIDATGLNESQIDVYGDAINIGKGEAAKRQTSYQDRDFLNMYNSLLDK